jgi:Cupin domain
MSLKPVRRIVTGHDRNRRSVIASDDTPRSIDFKAVPGTRFHEVWNTNEMPVPIDNAADPTGRPLQLQPKPNGSIIRIVDIPPDSVQNKVSAADVAAGFASMGAGHAVEGQRDARHRLMHRTQTIDYGIVLAGEIWLLVDDGEVRLGPGDIVIQRGTNHAWSNRTEEVARIAFILLDGKFAADVE